MKNATITMLATICLVIMTGLAGADEFDDRLAEVEARYGTITPDRDVTDQSSPEWMSVFAAKQAIAERDLGNLDEARRLIGMAATIASTN